MSVSNNNNNSNRGGSSSYKMAHVAAFEINLIYAACYLPVCPCVCVRVRVVFSVFPNCCSSPLSAISPFADKVCLLRSGNEFPTNNENENENKTLQCSVKSVDFSQRANAQMCESMCVCVRVQHAAHLCRATYCAYICYGRCLKLTIGF